MRHRFNNFACGLGWSVILCGCMDPPQSQPAGGPLKPPKTQEIGEFDPNAGNQIVDSKPVVTDPITGPLAILKYEQVRLPMLAIEHAVNLFNGLEGRYPNSHEEFMTRIIRENNIQLPVLPAGQEYQYDLENHKLVIAAVTEPKGDAPATP